MLTRTINGSKVVRIFFSDFDKLNEQTAGSAITELAKAQNAITHSGSGRELYFVQFIGFDKVPSSVQQLDVAELEWQVHEAAYSEQRELHQAPT